MSAKEKQIHTYSLFYFHVCAAGAPWPVRACRIPSFTLDFTNSGNERRGKAADRSTCTGPTSEPAAVGAVPVAIRLCLWCAVSCVAPCCLHRHQAHRPHSTTAAKTNLPPSPPLIGPLQSLPSCNTLCDCPRHLPGGSRCRSGITTRCD